MPCTAKGGKARISSIVVFVTVEGAYPPGELPVRLPRGSRLRELLREMLSRYRRAGEYLFDERSGALLANAAIINGEYLLLQENLDKVLIDGDQIFFILPIGGG